jgi:hypothetical protein
MKAIEAAAILATIALFCGCTVRPPCRLVDGKWYPVSKYATEWRYFPETSVVGMKGGKELETTAILRYVAHKPVPGKVLNKLKERLCEELKAVPVCSPDLTKRITAEFNKIIRKETGLDEQIICTEFTKWQVGRKGYWKRLEGRTKN